MSSNTVSYVPFPPRVWSRVQSPCTYKNSPNDSIVYVPFTGQTIPLAQALSEERNLYKGNILQYKINSSQLTKKQQYSQIAKGFGPSRRKVYATQSQTYTNPNVSGMLRVNFNTIPFPNQVVGSPNNVAGPFQTNVPNPFGCPTTSIQDGGNLVCGTYTNPCTGEITMTTDPSAGPYVCFPNYCSDVPGSPILLCWSNKIPTFFPRQRYFMNNSTDKWPEGYKGFVSAVTPDAPILSFELTFPMPPDPAALVELPTGALLSWTFVNSVCLPVSSFNIYQSGKIIANVPYTVTSYSVSGFDPCYVTALSGTIESIPSNIVNPII
jgi:hypothetical protein